jgi:hypothetical protein
MLHCAGTVGDDGLRNDLPDPYSPLLSLKIWRYSRSLQVLCQIESALKEWRMGALNFQLRAWQA